MEELTGEEHRKRHEVLHQEFDKLLADFITHTGSLPSKTSIMELVRWSFQQTQNPTETDAPE